MMGGFLSRVLLLAFGYAYPAYECYKTVELNKPEIEQLIFWCQYWILVALLTVLERFGDFTISWLPFYSEAKLMFFIYLWYPKTKGTTYIYGTFFKPYISQHENDIDRTTTTKTAAATVSTAAATTTTKTSTTRHAQSSIYAARQVAMVQQSQESKSVPSSPKIKRQASAKASSLVSTKSAPAASTTKPDESTKKSGVKPATEQVQTPATNAESPRSEPSAPSLAEAEGVDTMAIDDAGDTAEGSEELDPALEVEETPMEETIRVTRAKLRRRTAAGESAEN
ncbi:hypothetical protein PR202_gb29951 [Eleusine coracana subsp. coracana]|uniref:HVA22-like protein n=1 Tax=Eleusine coracana subsp. coracana TaxID=191504 RepID=A0AAV5G1X1_ELECO|nr:hypothetical protein PR202_gb29951 [Eleusine coracana subsp. coracana]